MPKKYKIKRYNLSRRYHSPGSVALRILCVVCFVSVLVFVGWNAYGPFVEYFNGALSAAVNHTPEDEPSQAPASPTPTATPAPEATLGAEIRAIYLPSSAFTDLTALEARLEALTRTDLNAVMFDLKDEDGNVLYRSQRELVTQAKSQSPTAFDLQTVCQMMKDKGIMPIGRISAFRDPIGAMNVDDAWVKYVGTETRWLDNAPESGGKPWLNPYSNMAQAYISDLVSESVSMGVKRIVLDNVSFPVGYGLEYASYGPNAGTATRTEVLTSFITAIDRQCADLGGMLMLAIPGPAALGMNTQPYGSNPLTLAPKNMLLDLRPAAFGDGLELEGFSLEQPVIHPYDTIDAVLQKLSPDITGKNVVALVQGNTSAQALEYNRPYTVEDVTAQLDALRGHRVDSYILFSPDGNYLGGY